MVCTPLSNGPARYVGDPIDVVTGATAYRNEDFRRVGPLPLVWARHYDSARNRVQGALGWGHSHEYDCRLEFDLDGMRYVGPLGRAVGFPPLARDGEEFSREGLRLERLTPRLYHLHQAGQPVREFELLATGSRAPLRRLFEGVHAIHFDYGPGDLLEAITDSLGGTIRVEHDGQGRVLSLVLVGASPGKHRDLLRCDYDRAGNLVELRDPYRNSLRFTWDSENRLRSKTDRLKYTFGFEYDAEGRCVYSSGQDGQFEVRLRYLTAERVTVVTRGDGGLWTYFYNAEGTVTRVLDPYGGSREFQVDDAGRVVAETDPGGNVTRILYRPDGSVYGKLSPLGEFSPSDADAASPAPGRYRVANCAAEWEYGQLLDPQTVVLPGPNDPVLNRAPAYVRQLVRTVSGERTGGAAAPTSREDAPPVEIDDLGLLLRQSGPEGTYRTWTYDANGNVRRFRDWDGSVFTDEYTSWNLLTRQFNAVGGVVSYSYTAAREMASVTDPGRSVTEYDYDLKDRLIRVRRHGVVREEYVYDQTDNLVEKRDGQGRPLLRWEIGPGNRESACHLASGGVIEFAHDQRGRLTGAAADGMEFQFAYDAVGNRTGDERDGRGVRHRFGWVRGCYVLRESTVLGRFTTRYEHGADGEVVIHDPAGRAHTVRMLGGGLVQREMSNRTAEVAQFDREGRCLFKVRKHGREYRDPWSQVYRYSAEGDLLRIEDSRRGDTAYAYDVAHRLVAERRPGEPTRQYRHDPANNLLEKPGLEGVALREGNRLERANGSRFEYNDRNHLARREGLGGAVRYTYDSWDRLVRIDGPDGEWRATYDPLGRRVSKAWADRRVDYYWDTDRLAAEVDGSGPVRVYVYASPLALVPLLFVDYEGLKADPASGTRYFLYGNQIGVPTLVEDDHGEVVWSAGVEPYGTLELAPDCRLELSLRFPGHYLDPETGLHYNRFRHYSPELGRYLESDPVGLRGGLNLYAYPNNPLSHVDVKGLAKICPKTGRITEDDGVTPKKELTPAEMAILQQRLDWIKKALDSGMDPRTGQPLTEQRAKELVDQYTAGQMQLNEAQRIDAMKKRAAAAAEAAQKKWEEENKFKKPKAGRDKAKNKDDIPDWVNDQRAGTDGQGAPEDPPRRGESPNDYADRVCRRKYGEDYDKGPGSEHSKIQKHVANDLEDPVRDR